MSTGAEDVKAALGLEPAFQRLAEDCRRTFGARLIAFYSESCEIGWDKWEAIKASAVTFEGDGEGWASIKAKALKAGDAARRRPTASQRGAVG